MLRTSKLEGKRNIRTSQPSRTNLINCDDSEQIQLTKITRHNMDEVHLFQDHTEEMGILGH